MTVRDQIGTKLLIILTCDIYKIFLNFHSKETKKRVRVISSKIISSNRGIGRFVKSSTDIFRSLTSSKIFCRM